MFLCASEKYLGIYIYMILNFISYFLFDFLSDIFEAIYIAEIYACCALGFDVEKKNRTGKNFWLLITVVTLFALKAKYISICLYD